MRREGFPFTADREGNPLARVSIHIGEVLVAREPSSVFTLLGSCVSACLFDPQNRLGGMNHILLPGRADLSRFDDAARYGINAMELLINSLMKAGARRGSLQAKVFGGARVLNNVPEELSPGRRNVAFLLEFLQMEQIPLLSRHVGGDRPMRVFFHTHTGEAFVQRVPEVNDLGAVKAEEESFLGRIARELGREGESVVFQPRKKSNAILFDKNPRIR